MCSAVSHKSALISIFSFWQCLYRWVELEENEKPNDGVILCDIKIVYIVTMLKCELVK
jgi:hypothetical protein